MRAEYHDDWAFPAGGPPTVVVSPSSTRTLAAAHRPRHRTGGPQIELRDGAWVAELTGLLDLSAWPVGTRLILRKERPHPGAQLRITDHDGMRVTGFLTNTAPGGPGRQLADLELRHRRHARVEDRILAGKDSGLRNLPRLRPEPDLGRHRRTGHRPARPHRTPRTARPGGDLRAQAAAAAHPGRGRTPRALRPTPRPAHRPRLALGRTHHHRAHPAVLAARTLNTRPPTRRPGPGAPADTLSRRSPLPAHTKHNQQDHRAAAEITVRPLRKIEACSRGMSFVETEWSRRGQPRRRHLRTHKLRVAVEQAACEEYHTLVPRPSASPAATDGQILKPAVRLSWLDVLLIALIAVGSLALGRILPATMALVSDDPVPPIAAFEVDGGLVRAQNDLNLLQARQTKVHDAIASLYVGLSMPTAPAGDGMPDAATPVQTQSPQAILLALQRDSSAITDAQIECQKRLIEIREDATKKRDDAVNDRTWQDRGVTTTVSLAVLASGMILLIILRALLQLQVNTRLVLVGLVAVTALLLLVQNVSWVAAVGAATIGLLLIVRGKS